jgi:ABC-type lipoprotein export system ATPase subunit
VAAGVAEKAVDFAKEQDLAKLLDLETVPLLDLPEISFEVESGKYKPLNELSVGTKSTVILLLVMIEGKVPLVIDQPEDSLDTEFIYNEIVHRLRNDKESRQFVFTSHNANVVICVVIH